MKPPQPVPCTVLQHRESQQSQSSWRHRQRSSNGVGPRHQPDDVVQQPADVRFACLAKSGHPNYFTS